jgi:predicted O-methyltransferase YrrM
MVLINKKEYPGTHFKEIHNEEYFNLKIYPQLNELETDAGFISDFVEAYQLEGKTLEVEIRGNCELTDFVRDNTPKTKSLSKIVYVYSHFEKIEIPDNIKVFISNFNDHLVENPYKIKFGNKYIYLTDESLPIFQKHFWYYFKNETFCYSNLICYTMIIKNGGPLLEQVLTENLGIIDRWCILDTGSTDGTQDIIRRVLKNHKGQLYSEPFVDFKVSRNRCLELAGKSCKFILMLDDTYSMRLDLRGFLDEVRGDQFSDSFSLMIQSDDTEYYSNRIIKSKTELRYIHTIHEVITDKDNINVTVPVNRAYIYDHRADYMETRTNNRKQFDLNLLFKEVEDYPDDPRSLYYIAQTYGCIGDEVNKAKYFELRINHPVQGYIQEKIDACFELGRCYNFKVNCFTKELKQNGVSPEEWEIIEKLYLQAYSLDKKRPDGLYFIGIHYYLNKNYQIAYDYFKLAFETGYPLESQYSLKPTLSFHFLPRFLAEVCYYQKDFQLGLKACELFLSSEKFNKPGDESWNLMQNWYSIHSNLVKMEINKIYKVNIQKKLIVFVTDGGWEPWSGKDILTKGMGGSETWIIETARYLVSEETDVAVFCNTLEPSYFEGVGYNPISLFHNFVANNFVDTVIISRHTEYIPVAIHGNTGSVYVIFHDVLVPETIIPYHYKIKCLFGLTDWHSSMIKNNFPGFQVKTSNYGINPSDSVYSKNKNSFIYSSFPTRGLVVLLKMWKQIKTLLPDATLNIFCDLEHKWSNQVAPQMMNEIKSLLKLNKNGIKVHGWVTKSVLTSYFQESEYWMYPCIFEETFCLTAMEAAVNGCFVITNGLAALGETVGNRGLIIPGNPLTLSWQNECLLQLSKLTEDFKQTKIQENYQHALSLSWKSQTEKFKELIKEEMLNWTNDVPPGTKQHFISILKSLPVGSNILEIGTFEGTGLVEMLKTVPESTATVIDFWENYYEQDNLLKTKTIVNYKTDTEFNFYKNTKNFKDRITVLKGKSNEMLKNLKDQFNFIYIDGSHKCMDVYFDAMMAYELLKTGGIIAFDDYRFNKGDILNSPYEAIEHFRKEKNLTLIHEDYRIFFKKN